MCKKGMSWLYPHSFEVKSYDMRIEHSPLFNDFLSFYFETSVDGEKVYETILDYTQLKWWTQTIADSLKPYFLGISIEQ
jgi:hypothetical protein